MEAVIGRCVPNFRFTATYWVIGRITGITGTLSKGLLVDVPGAGPHSLHREAKTCSLKRRTIQKLNEDVYSPSFALFLPPSLRQAPAISLIPADIANAIILGQSEQATNLSAFRWRPTHCSSQPKPRAITDKRPRPQNPLVDVLH